MGTMKKCAICELINPPDASNCRRCNASTWIEVEVGEPSSEPKKAPAFAPGFNIVPAIVGVFVVMGAIVAAGLWLRSSEPCPKREVLAYADRASAMVEQWREAESRARNTTKITLGREIANLQRVRNEFAALSHPKCAEATSREIAAAMDQWIENMAVFMSKESEDAVAAEAAQAGAVASRAAAEIEKLRASVAND